MIYNVKPTCAVYYCKKPTKWVVTFKTNPFIGGVGYCEEHTKENEEIIDSKKAYSKDLDGKTEPSFN